MSKRLIYAEDAIEALEALFVKQIKQFDYDSYEKADEKTQLVCDGISESIGCLLNMPSAQPQRIKGRWVGTDYDGFADGNPVYDEWKCSICGCMVEDEEPTWKFCPNCGADMRGDDDE